MSEYIITLKYRTDKNESFAGLISGSTASVFTDVTKIISQQRLERFEGHVIQNVDLANKIRGFENLLPNWDSYNADPTSLMAVATAMKVLYHLGRASVSHEQMTTNVFPMRDGGIQFEFDCEGLSAELEINPNGELLLLFFDDGGNILERIETFELSEIPNLLEEAQYA